MNDCVEAFFDKVVEWPFKDIHKVGAVPTAEIRTRFMAPSKLGDLLVLGLNGTTVGRTSCGIAISAQCDGEVRFQTELTIVNVDSSGKPEPWPEQVKQRFLDQLALA